MRTRHRALHRLAWLALAVALPAMLLAALLARPERAADAPVRLAAPEARR